MEFCAYPSHSLQPFPPASSVSFGDAVIRVKEYASSAVSVILGNVFSVIFTFLFASGVCFFICCAIQGFFS